ncbi:MAG: hypothetical protein JAY75_02140 [Candidatus Thiodiazotropha taylori]|nr:hypothetical protein [Candidatus Thiodiazotropha taylori]MCW4307006.1 hypothetical protein [Candidatus Thiodiazotropha endolucinida]
MHRGYYIEEELKDYLLWSDSTSSGSGMLQKEFEGLLEDNERLERGKWIKDTLIQAMKINLRTAIFDYARHQCQGCRVNHPSQKYHDLCLWTKPNEWITDYGIHIHALKNLYVYDVIQKWDQLLLEEIPSEQRRNEYGAMTGLDHLTPSEKVEAYKNWVFLKNSHNRYGRKPEYTEWRDFWKYKLLGTQPSPPPSPPPEVDI